MENTHSKKNPLTYQFDLETTEPICCTHNKECSEGEINVETYILDTLVHVDNINQLASKHCCDPVAEEEPNKFILGQKEPLIAEWSYIICNPKHLDTSGTVYDVGDLVGPHGFVSKTYQKHSMSCGRNNKNMGRSIAHLGMAGKQSTDMVMSSIDDAKRWCLENGRHVDSFNDIMTFQPPPKIFILLSWLRQTLGRYTHIFLQLEGRQHPPKLQIFTSICILMQWIGIQVSKDAGK
jgi:hypothetical protein